MNPAEKADAMDGATLSYQRQSLKQSVTEAMQRYFSDLDGQSTQN